MLFYCVIEGVMSPASSGLNIIVNTPLHFCLALQNRMNLIGKGIRGSAKVMMKNLILVFGSTWSTHLHEMNIGCLDEWLNEVF